MTESLISISTNGDITLVSFMNTTITGGPGMDMITDQVRKFIQTQRPGRLIFDFSSVKFFSSQMLGLLVETWRTMNEYHGKMIISGINPQLNRVFKITNLDQIFQFSETIDQASILLNG